ncbi:uncharacterized mitochondrial protein-like protein [Tanacetum coccineum]
MGQMVSLSDPSILTRPSCSKLYMISIIGPDLAFAAQAFSQFLQHPRTIHMKALIKVLRYVKLSIGQVLFFPTTNNLNLTTYCDRDWASCPFSRRFITGYGIFLVPIMCDNASAIALASNPVHHARTKQIEIDCHFVRDKIKAG